MEAVDFRILMVTSGCFSAPEFLGGSESNVTTIFVVGFGVLESELFMARREATNRVRVRALDCG